MHALRYIQENEKYGDLENVTWIFQICHIQLKQKQPRRWHSELER